jgi:hypothetical protein
VLSSLQGLSLDGWQGHVLGMTQADVQRDHMAHVLRMTSERSLMEESAAFSTKLIRLSALSLPIMDVKSFLV